MPERVPGDRVAFVRHDATTNEVAVMALPNTPAMRDHILACQRCGIGGHLCWVGNVLAGTSCTTCQNTGYMPDLVQGSLVPCTVCGGTPVVQGGALG